MDGAIEQNPIPKSRDDRLIMDYLVTEGYKEAAEKFRIESGTQPSIPLDSLDNRIKIREAIQRGDLEEAVALTNKLNPEILDTNQLLYFHLQQQRLIELIREKDIVSAVEFAQNQLAEQGQESSNFLEELEQTMALLAFENPRKILHLASFFTLLKDRKLQVS